MQYEPIERHGKVKKENEEREIAKWPHGA
jgi:hypothetical protein